MAAIKQPKEEGRKMSKVTKSVVFSNLAAEDLVPAKTVKSWKKSEQYVGFLLETKALETQNGPGKIYTFQNGNDTGKATEGTSAFWGCANLDRELAKVMKGQLVLLVCNGQAKNPKTGRIYQSFNVQVANVMLPAETMRTMKVKKPSTSGHDDLEDLNWQE